MKKFLIITLLVVCMAGVSFAELTFGSDFYNRNVRTAFSRNSNDPLLGFISEVEGLIEAGQLIGTGKVFYVDSNVTREGDGTTWTKAKDTLDEAIALCTAARGDIILVAQGHQEVKAASGDVFTLDIAGVSVIGVSNGGYSGPIAAGAATLNLMPVFILDHADATATISAPNCKIQGLRFESDVADNAIGLTMSAAADGSIVFNCVFRDGAVAEEMVIAINVAANCDAIQLVGNTFSTVPSGGCANAIVLAGGSDNSVIAGNTAYGTYSAGTVLATAAASINLTVRDNLFANVGAIAFDGHASTTGLFVNNMLGGTTSMAAALTDVAGMVCLQNFVTGNVGASGIILPAIDVD